MNLKRQAIHRGNDINAFSYNALLHEVMPSHDVHTQEAIHSQNANVQEVMTQQPHSSYNSL